MKKHEAIIVGTAIVGIFASALGLVGLYSTEAARTPLANIQRGNPFPPSRSAPTSTTQKPESFEVKPQSKAAEPKKTGEVLFSCDFETEYCGFEEQSKNRPERRSAFTPIARTGSFGIKLTTLPGDSEVNGSGMWERNDLQLPPSSSYCNDGQEEWWALSAYFPSDYVMPKKGGVVMDFHHNASAGQANFHFNSQPTGLRFHGFYGDVKNPTEYKVELGRLERNVWYDLVLRVRWSSKNDGSMEAWLNGKKRLTHYGPTLYPGIPCYLKLANYHDASGKPSSIIFDRVILGTSAAAVSLTPLEGTR